MGLRERAKLGELERKNAQLHGRIAELTVEHELLRATAEKVHRALEQENHRLSASLAETRYQVEHLRAALKRANDARAGLGAELQNSKQPKSDHALTVIQTTAGISAAARAHLRRLYDAACEEWSQDLRTPIAAIIQAHARGWAVSPGTCDELGKALRIVGIGFFRWLIRRSPLISAHGRDEKQRVIYMLHLEYLTMDEFPRLQNSGAGAAQDAVGES